MISDSVVGRLVFNDLSRYDNGGQSPKLREQGTTER